MYEMDFFPETQMLLDVAMARVGEAELVEALEEDASPFLTASLSESVELLYETVRTEEGLGIRRFEVLVRPWRNLKLRDVFCVSPFYRVANDEPIWHSEVLFDSECECGLPFVVANAWRDRALFDHYQSGGFAHLTITGLGVYLECRNEHCILSGADCRQGEGLPNRFDLSHVRALSGCDLEDAPAMAEFYSVVEDVNFECVEGELCWKLMVWSAPPNLPNGFSWQLLVPEHCIKEHYIPRVGDAIAGKAALFGWFSPSLPEKPFARATIHYPEDVFLAEEAAEAVEDETEPTPTEEAVEEMASVDRMLLPRGLEHYPKVEDFGGGLEASVAEVYPAFVTYSDYLRYKPDDLEALPPLKREELIAILEQIPEVSQHLLYSFEILADQLNVLHVAHTPSTGERHLWCACPSPRQASEHYTSLLVAVDSTGKVLRYTLLSGYQSLPEERFSFVYENGWFESVKELEEYFSRCQEEDFFIVVPLAYSEFFQGIQTEDGLWQVEWQIHNVKWQFRTVKSVPLARVLEMLHTYLAQGVVALQTMERWEKVSFE